MFIEVSKRPRSMLLVAFDVLKLTEEKARADDFCHERQNWTGKCEFGGNKESGYVRRV
jgi:hypothetical protein